MKQTLVQKLLHERKLDSSYIDNQNLISKLSLLELLQKYEKYACLDSNYETKYYKRIEKSLSFIPEDHKVAALTLFANTFYVSEAMLSDALAYLYKEVVALYGNEKGLIDSMHVFEVDPSGLIESFFRINQVAGRLDSNTFSRLKSVGDFITALNNFISCEALQINSALISNIKGILNKKNWIVLADFSFSGTSLKSDIERLLILRNLCFPDMEKPNIIVCVQLISAKALKLIDDEFGSVIKFLFAQCYGHDLRIVPMDVWKTEKVAVPPNCLLFEKDKGVYDRILNLCTWFASEYIDIDPAHKITADQGALKTLAFGYKDCGYTVIPQRNALSNSLPILWYTPSEDFKLLHKKDYIPPFPRTISRISQSTSGDKEHLKNIQGNSITLQQRLVNIRK